MITDGNFNDDTCLSKGGGGDDSGSGEKIDASNLQEGHQNQQTPFGDPYEITVHDLVKMDNEFRNSEEIVFTEEMWKLLMTANDTINKYFEEARLENKKMILGKFPIIKFLVDERREKDYYGEIIRLNDDSGNDVYVLRHPSLMVNQNNEKEIILNSRTSIIFVKRISKSFELVSEYEYITDENNQLIEGNPLQSELLKNKGMRTDNQTSLFNYRAKTVVLKIWGTREDGTKIQIPIPILDSDGKLTIEETSNAGTDLRSFSQIYGENTSSIDGQDFIDLESFYQDVYNNASSKWSQIFANYWDNHRVRIINKELLESFNRIIKGMRLGLLSKDNIPVFFNSGLNSDLNKYLKDGIKELTARQVLGNN